MSSFKVLLYSELDKITIMKEYGKTPETVCQDIKIIQKWMVKQPHLPEIADENVIEKFLMISKYSIERTKAKLDMYYSARSIVPDLFDKNPNDPNTQKTMDMIYYLPLPKLTNQLYRVTVMKLSGKYTDDFNAIMYIAHTLNVAEIRIREDYCLSDVHIHDLEGVKMNHLIQFTPSVIKKGIFVMERVYNSRLKGIHIINAPDFLGPFVTILKAALKAKIADRVFIHADMESLYKMVPKEVLPKEYGGEEKCFEELNDDWKKKFLEYDGLFQHLHSIKVKNELRPGNSIDSEFFGIEGTFKQLQELD